VLGLLLELQCLLLELLCLLDDTRDFELWKWRWVGEHVVRGEVVIVETVD
jgi:hypothetical protein